MARGTLMRFGLGLAATGAVVCGAAGEVRLGYLTLEDAYVERQKMATGLMDEGEKTLRDLIATFDSVAGRADLEGLVVRLRDPKLSATQIQEIGRAMGRVRDAGKRIHVFTENYGTGQILVGCHADEIILQDGGSVSVPGVYMEEMFLADTLRWVGIEPDFVQIGDYKGAMEMMGNSAPSPAWEKNISGLLDSIYDEILGSIMRGRGMSRGEAEAAIGECFWANGERAIEAGLIDAEIDRMDLSLHLEAAYGDGVSLESDVWVTSGPAVPDLSKMGMFEAFGAMMRMFGESGPREPARETIAVLYIDGMIVDGESSGGGLFGGGGSVGSVTIRKALKEIEKNELVKGVVVRIDSPGGSATASEMIWRGLERVREAGKPVWVSVGSMAASGGYYIAVGGDRIFVNRSSIVGSIGVVGGHLSMGGLYEKLKMNVVARSRGPRAEIMGTIDVWSDAERSLIRSRMTETYDLFTRRVEAGRSGIDLGRTAEGRLFLGEDAVDLRMADGIAGIDQVLTRLAGEAGLSEGSYDVLDYPAPLTFGEFLEQAFGVQARAGMGGSRGDIPVGLLEEAAMGVVGQDAWRQIRWGIGAALEFRERPVMLVMPRVLVWRW